MGTFSTKFNIGDEVAYDKNPENRIIVVAFYIDVNSIQVLCRFIDPRASDRYFSENDLITFVSK